MPVIYRITNMANDHYYIGSAESFERRKWQHTYALKRGEHKNPRLQAAWNKYGPDMFVFEVLEELAAGVNLLQVEDMWLVQHVGRPDCYNINPSAESPRSGIVLSVEAKANISKGRKGKAAGENHYRYGQTVSEEVRAKIGAAQKGKPKAPGRKVSEAGRAKIKANIEAGRSHKHWTGRKHTNESKKKMSRAIIVYLPNGAMLHMASITHLRLVYGIKAPTVNRALKSGAPLVKGKFAGWRFVYVDVDPGPGV